MHWGLLGPENLATTRRTRALGIGAAVRKFNQLAVPGIGGVWFAKQIFLATLGVRLADRLRGINPNVKAIETANAVEALACWYAFKSNGWSGDSRLRGRLKLAGQEGLTFSRLRQSRFYVVQPMRMATVEALVELGFVEAVSQRFNSFRCSQIGMDLIETATAGYKPRNQTVENYLVERCLDKNAQFTSSEMLQEALSPLVSMSSAARLLIRERLCAVTGQDREGSTRRKNALAWVSSLDRRAPANWETKPIQLEEDHWQDLRSGARFFRVRDAAIAVMETMEAQLAPLASRSISADIMANSAPVKASLKQLADAANRFLEEQHDPSDERMVTAFCHECLEADRAAIIRNLVMRDGRVLRLVGNDVRDGAAFSRQVRTSSSEEEEEEEEPSANDIGDVPVPADISGRVHNLYLLELDLQGRLDEFLDQSLVENPA